MMGTEIDKVDLAVIVDEKLGVLTRYDRAVNGLYDQ